MKFLLPTCIARPLVRVPLLGGAALLALAVSGCNLFQKPPPTQPMPMRTGRTAAQAIVSRTAKTALQSTPPARVVQVIRKVEGSHQQQPEGPPPFMWPAGMERVAFLPIYTTLPTGNTVDDLDSIFRAELAKELPMEVVHLTRAEMEAITGQRHIASTSMIPEELLRALKERYACQGVVFTDMPVYRPYRPISMGVRCKLVDLSNMGVVWSADGVLDSAEPGIAQSALSFAQGNLQGVGADTSTVVLQSPRRYAAFVAYEVFNTLPGKSPTPGESAVPSL